MHILNTLYDNIDIYMMWAIATVLVFIIVYQISYDVHYYVTDGVIVDEIKLL